MIDTERHEKYGVVILVGAPKHESTVVPEPKPSHDRECPKCGRTIYETVIVHYCPKDENGYGNWVDEEGTED